MLEFEPRIFKKKNIKSQRGEYFFLLNRKYINFLTKKRKKVI